MTAPMPIVLASQINFSGAIGNIKTPADPSELQCPEGTAMLVDEIRFTVAGISSYLGEFEISIGRSKITNGFLPTSLFCRHENPALSNVSIQSGFIEGNTLWRLPRPLFVPKGRAISFTAKDGAGGDTTIYVSLKARVLGANDPEPRVVDVPYVSAFYPPAASILLDAADTTSIDRSVTGELGNPFQSPLNVQSFLTWSDVVNNQDVYNLATGAKRVSCYYGQVQIFDWNGNPLVRTPTRLSHLCTSKGTNEWAQPFVLPPQRSLYAVLDRTHPDISTRASHRPGIAISGWRSVPLSEVK